MIAPRPTVSPFSLGSEAQIGLISLEMNDWIGLSTAIIVIISATVELIVQNRQLRALREELEGTKAPVGPPPVPTGYKSVIAKSSNKKMDQPFSDLHDFMTFFEEHGFGLETTRLEDWVSPRTLLSASLFSPRVDETLERMRSYTDVASISST